MHDGVGPREGQADRVVVGHDQLDAQLARQLGSRTADIPQSTVTISDAFCSETNGGVPRN